MCTNRPARDGKERISSLGSYTAMAHSRVYKQFRLQPCGSEAVTELPGYILPSTVANPVGRDRVPLRAKVLLNAGNYKLTIDVVQESACWFSDRGSGPLEFLLQVE